MAPPIPIACNLTAIPDAERPRYFALRSEILAAVTSVTELPDGYSLHLPEGRTPLVALAEWIAFERVCCPFLRFRLSVDAESPLRLDLLGDDGVKDFLRAELDPIGASHLVSAASLVRRP
jgi:hypothetical protein